MRILLQYVTPQANQNRQTTCNVNMHPVNLELPSKWNSAAFIFNRRKERHTSLKKSQPLLTMLPEPRRHLLQERNARAVRGIAVIRNTCQPFALHLKREDERRSLSSDTCQSEAPIYCHREGHPSVFSRLSCSKRSQTDPCLRSLPM